MKSFVVISTSLLLISCSSVDGQRNKNADDPDQNPILAYEILGNPDAPVTLIEYSDYQCPFCRKFTTEVLPNIQKTYIDTGVVRLIFRDYPLHIHPLAIEAAIATHCAGRQGSYYPYHDLLFSRTKEIANEKFGVWAEELGLNGNTFSTCLTDPTVRDKVMMNIREAKQNGVVGTPSFLINGRYIAGAQPFSFFERAIKGALDKEIETPLLSEDAECIADADCGEPRTFPEYCSRTSDTDTCTTSAIPTCTYPGTEESACVMIIKESCLPCSGDKVCAEGACLDITDFTSCVTAGNAVMESYPRQCRTADGRLFVEKIDNEL